MEVSVFVFYLLYLAVNGEPVGMNVEKTHEDRHHDAAIVEVSVFVHLFYYDYFPIGWRNHHFLRVAIEHAYGAAEEVNNDAIGNAVYHQECPKRHFTLKKHP